MNTLGLAALVTTVAVGAAVCSTYRRKRNKVQHWVTEGGKIVETKVGPIEYGDSRIRCACPRDLWCRRWLEWRQNMGSPRSRGRLRSVSR